MDVTHRKIGVVPKGVIVVAGDVVNFRAVARHFHHPLDDLGVLLREVALFELPDVNEIPVEHQHFGLDALEVVQQFFGMAAVGAKVYIGYDGNLQLSFHQFAICPGGFRKIENKVGVGV